MQTNLLRMRIRMKRETKGFGTGTLLGEGVMKEKKFTHNRKPSQKQGQWELRKLRRKTEKNSPQK